MKIDEGDGFRTKAVHSGNRPHLGSANTPIYLSTTYQFDDERYKTWCAGERETLVYSRFTTPNTDAVADKVAALEGGEAALVFSSGMAAITTTVMGLLSQGDHIVTAPDIYGGTYGLFVNELHRFGIELTFADMREPASYEEAIQENTKMLYIETLTNPVLNVTDLDAFVDIAKRHDLLLVVDNTFATPYGCRPLEYGADIVLHSTTKFMNGHSDALGGVVISSEKLVKRMFKPMVSFGAAPDPHAAWLLERGMKTLPLRVKAAAENGEAVAKAIVGHKNIVSVIHPSLDFHPDYEIGQKYIPMGTGMVSFVVKGGDEAGVGLLRAMRLPMEATSLGGVEALAECPFNTSHASMPENVRINAGILPGFVRLSCGIEDTDDLVNDILQALDQI